MPNNYKIKNALISVSDKTGIVEFAQQLVALGVTIYSTGGTENLLAKNNIDVKNISSLTNFPEILDGRVKTLHPAVHAGLLADLSNPEHVNTLAVHKLEPIDLVVVNLYPFEETLKKIADYEKSLPELIEQIDIGGPTMLRSAAKNYKWTAAVVEPEDYKQILNYLNTNDMTIPLTLRQTLAGKVFNYTAHYDAVISNYFNKINKLEFPETLTLTYAKAQICRYGENPHQSAAIYGDFLSQFNVLHGKELSYNNVMDISAICDIMLEFEKPTVAIVKHTTPCGVASYDNLIEAYRMAFATDTESPFGGIIAVNGTIDVDFAKEVHALFSEVIIAEEITGEALEILTKKKDRRLVIADYAAIRQTTGYMCRSVQNGLLYQKADTSLFDGELQCVTSRKPTESELQKMLFAWKIVKHVKSNAIVFADANRTLAIGAGQTSRVDSSRIAIEKAKTGGLDLTDSAMASDAFLPFADSLIEAVNAGTSCIIQPGGSVRDSEVIDAANKHNIVMCFTRQRHFRH